MPDQPDIAPDRPLVILDVDEVLALFFQGFGRFVAQRGYELRCERFALFGNLYAAGAKEPVGMEIGRPLFNAFFLEGGDLMDHAPGAPESLAALSEAASVVILSNAPAHGRDERLRWLQRCAMDYPLIINEGPKGPAIAALAARTSRPAVFVDDIVSHLDSCLTDAPRVTRFQTVADPGLRSLAPTPARAPPHRRLGRPSGPPFRRRSGDDPHRRRLRRHQDRGGGHLSQRPLRRPHAPPQPRRLSGGAGRHRGFGRRDRGSIGQPVAHVGVGTPGSVSPETGLIRGANSTWLNGKPFGRDLENRLDRQVTLANDANCFALSEALPELADKVVFGAILGTGCGGGLVVRGAIVPGAGNAAGEWGHAPLPWPSREENGSRRCWCGRRDCLETFISGSGFEADYARTVGQRLAAPAIVEAARAGEPHAKGALDRYIDRLARGLAVICDLIDPDVIVLGGGMSNIAELYSEALTKPLAAHVFTDSFRTVVRKPKHGDSSGVRGAAWLVPL